MYLTREGRRGRNRTGCKGDERNETDLLVRISKSLSDMKKDGVTKIYMKKKMVLKGEREEVNQFHLESEE